MNDVSKICGCGCKITTKCWNIGKLTDWKWYILICNIPSPVLNWLKYIYHMILFNDSKVSYISLIGSISLSENSVTQCFSKNKVPRKVSELAKIRCTNKMHIVKRLRSPLDSLTVFLTNDSKIMLLTSRPCSTHFVKLKTILNDEMMLTVKILPDIAKKCIFSWCCFFEWLIDKSASIWCTHHTIRYS